VGCAASRTCMDVCICVDDDQRRTTIRKKWTQYTDRRSCSAWMSHTTFSFVALIIHLCMMQVSSSLLPSDNYHASEEQPKQYLASCLQSSKQWCGTILRGRNCRVGCMQTQANNAIASVGETGEIVHRSCSTRHQRPSLCRPAIKLHASI
jgi:hypothetical protein